MKFISEKAKKIASFIRKNPKAKPKDVAQTLGVKIAYVYNIKNRLKKGRPQVKEGKPVEPSSVRKAIDLTKAEKIELVKALEGWQEKYTNDPRMPVFKAKPMPLPNSYNDVTSEIAEVMKEKEELRNQVLDCKAVISYLENAVVALIKKSN
jgi:sugar-specific transcriptional regulator TrmB